ncbi:Uncharacterised protein [uncultured Roseburia sp.]|uniref:DUF4430 domain-containing protein n=1 Tax=Brotonthovivens ammoniilytica TaxID=2981725 RepID=A0ABT2TLB0_9FIRM|nr:DUF4430 domain-containing protein [Brotonthovivens ammoniilytica]MCU6762626.1 DUF4430 domain-containing protein [Brotonthovivens ammoniilytica]SCI77785.1 Uncharacterised protein [uncultured Roseburia sp.]
MREKAGFRKKILLPVTLAGIAAALIFTAVFLSTRQAAPDVNPIQGVNDGRSRVFVTGEGYSLNYEQEQEYIKEKQQKEKQIEQEIKQKPEQKKFSQAKATKAPQNQAVTNRKDAEPNDLEKPAGNNGKDTETESEQQPDTESPDEPEQPGGSKDEGSGDEENPGDEGGGTNTDEDGDDQTSKIPVITCNLKDGKEISGDEVTVTVKVQDYKKNYLSSFYVDVLVNGNKVTSSGTTNHVITYRCQELKDGSNEIVIKARDQEGNTAEKRYTVIADADAEKKKGGTVTFTMHANQLGLGTLVHKTAEFYVGESMADVINRECEAAGYQVVSGKSPAQGFYISRIKKKGITDGWSISQEKLDQLGITDTSDLVYQKDSLGEKDFYKDSGWLYSVNGEYLDGMSAVTVYDGDEIVFFFSLDYH